MSSIDSATLCFSFKSNLLSSCVQKILHLFCFRNYIKLMDCK